MGSRRRRRRPRSGRGPTETSSTGRSGPAGSTSPGATAASSASAAPLRPVSTKRRRPTSKPHSPCTTSPTKSSRSSCSTTPSTSVGFPAAASTTSWSERRAQQVSGERHRAQYATGPVCGPGRARRRDWFEGVALLVAAHGSDVVVEGELIRMRAKAQGVDLVLALVLDPRLDQIVGEHAAGAEVVVVLLEGD